MATLSFPPLHNLSQNPEDQESLQRIKIVWDEYSSGWDQETRLTILSHLHNVRVTSSNRWKPCEHKLRKVEFNFGIWVMLRCIYPNCKMQSLKTRLVGKYPWIDVDSFVGPGQGRPTDDMGDAYGTTAAGGSMKPDLDQHWQGFQMQAQDYVASSSDNNERLVKRESNLAPVFTQPRHRDGIDRQQDLSFSNLRPVQSLFPQRQNAAQPITPYPPRANPFPDVNPQLPGRHDPQSDSFANFLKRKAEDNIPNTPSKKPGFSAARAPSPVGFDSRSSFLDDEPEAAPEDHQRSYDSPKECCKLYHERRKAEFTEVLDQTLQRMQADLKTLVQRHGEEMKRAANSPNAQQQQQRRSGDDNFDRDALLERLDTRITRIEELLRLQ
ncbi:hypothetical protein CEP54_000808 [Fusarium duplospermum]|uniref:Uncharacterized protein n=1 Tax=Fusarium duplospermum TaxID=1325734 RepID=A0A428R422_9HYPO|nr:hypothetical protein CEP54_000808 [Fusarium duplospermum]